MVKNLFYQILSSMISRRRNGTNPWLHTPGTESIYPSPLQFEKDSPGEETYFLYNLYIRQYLFP